MKRTFLFFKTRTITSLVVLLMTLPVWGDDGDTFTEETVEGVMLTYTVISESEKTCMVGEEYNWPVPCARTDRVRKVSESQPSGDITIPEVANGYTVIRIEAFAFENAAITSVVIPNSVKNIGPDAFFQCADLRFVKLSNQLTKIESETFMYCENLMSIDIPEGVTSIGDYAFACCKQLKEAIIPSSVEHFGECVFWNTGFTSPPKLPDNLTTIPKGMFYDCTQLTSIEIPQNITRIGDTAFGRCPISEIEIPASVVHIGVASFANCKNLTNLVIPDNVTAIDFNAFKGCSNLKTVTLSNNLSSFSEGIFSECTSLESISIPSGVKSIGLSAFESCSSLRSISIPETVERIDNRVFYGCSSLTQIFIPKSVISIETYNNWPLLYACNSLTSIIVDEDNPVYDSRYDCNAIIETASNKIIAGCTATTIPEGITTIGSWAFCGYENLTSITLPQSLKIIEGGAFAWLGLKEINIPENVTSIGSYAFNNCKHLEKVKSYIKEPFEIPEKAFSISFYDGLIDATLYVPKGTIDKYKATKGWNVFSSIKENTEPDINIAYRPFVEDGKVWKVGDITSGNPTQCVEHFYFDGDTIIGGRTCKQMMCQQYVSPDFHSQRPSLDYVGAWYEEDKKVYFCDATSNQFKLMYDFSNDGNDTLQINNDLYVIGPRQTGDISGFKGAYRKVWQWLDGESIYSVPWLEGVGGTDRPTTNVYSGYVDPLWALMSCTVDDEVIYLREGWEDGDTPGGIKDRKRFDFTHTIKTQPKMPRREPTPDASQEEGSLLYGEYSNLQLDINLNPLADAYLVRITDESGKAVYEKNVNAASIVGLSIDISAYAVGRYTVTVENSQETFTGVFETVTTGIEEIQAGTEACSGWHGACPYTGAIYNLQGQRIRSLQKGLNIVNGQKVIVQKPTK